jgi:hypothetical protein
VLFAGGMTISLPLRDSDATAYAQALPTHKVPAAQQAGVVLQLCDGATNTEVKGLRPGEAMSHEQAVAVTGKLMAEWQRKHPGQHWEMAQANSGAAAFATPTAATPNSSPAPVASTKTTGQMNAQQGDT